MFDISTSWILRACQFLVQCTVSSHIYQHTSRHRFLLGPPPFPPNRSCKSWKFSLRSLCLIWRLVNNLSLKTKIIIRLNAYLDEWTFDFLVKVGVVCRQIILGLTFWLSPNLRFRPLVYYLLLKILKLFAAADATLDGNSGNLGSELSWPWWLKITGLALLGSGLVTSFASD